MLEKCETCLRYAFKQRKRKMAQIEIRDPFYRLGIDIADPLPRSKTRKCYIIAAIDHLTRWCKAKALNTKEVNEVAGFIIDKVIVRHGAPNCILNN